MQDGTNADMPIGALGLHLMNYNSTKVMNYISSLPVHITLDYQDYPQQVVLAVDDVSL